MLDGAEPLVLSKARLFVLAQRADVRWGNLSQIKAQYVLFEEALKHGPDAYYHLLSGQAVSYTHLYPLCHLLGAFVVASRLWYHRHPHHIHPDSGQSAE